MKRMKKLLTGLLTLGMTLSMMTMTAFAAEPSAKMPTIDTDPDKQQIVENIVAYAHLSLIHI